MPVKIWTGLPGAGKTAALVEAILAFKVKHPDRPVYAININGLAPGIAEPLTLQELSRWWELPPGSLICIDECQEDDFFPLDQGKPEEWVKRISKVRHEGMDFWMTTQHPSLMSSYVRRLVDQHVHTVRKFNTSIVQRYTWGRCMEGCEKGGAQKAAVVTTGTLPKAVFDSYKSSNDHNMKTRVPFRVYALVACVVVAIAGACAAPYMIHRAQAKNIESLSGSKAEGVSDGKVVDDAMRHKDYAKWLEPRVVGMPWTAPAYDAAAVKAEPKIYCIAWEDGKTNCITEQGTRLNVPAVTARLIAMNGVYNPFLPPERNVDEVRGSRRGQSVEPQARTEPGGLPDGPSLSVRRKERVTSHAYIPPEEMDPLPDTGGYISAK